MGRGREESSEATIGGNIEQLSVWGTHRHHHHQLRPGPELKMPGGGMQPSSLAQSCNSPCSPRRGSGFNLKLGRGGARLLASN